MRYPYIVLLLHLILPVAGLSQSQHDTTYYVSYTDQITSRFYFSKKSTRLLLRNKTQGYSLDYRPNTTLNMGIGATYRWATLNLAYGFGFLNPDRGKGKTKYLDLQFHSYGRKLLIDLFGQFYRGFYLYPRGHGLPDDNKYYQRPDIHLNELGISAQYVFNSSQMSYRASYFLNEWQKKSTGTFLAGFEIYGGRIESDSSIVPATIEGEIADAGLHKLNFFDIGLNGGYAYTWVIKKHFFVTASASASLDYGVSTWTSAERSLSSAGVSPNTFFRFFGGYNSSRWGASIVYISNRVFLSSNRLNRRVTLATGNFRLNFVYRFPPGKKAKKMLEVIDDIPLEH